MPTTIAVISVKGGVGKTATTHNLGVALAEHATGVLLIDMDPQAALTAGLGVHVAELEASIYDVLVGSATPRHIMEQPLKKVSLLPASLDLAGAELKLANEYSREYILRDKLRAVDHPYILIDCPPSLGLLTINAMCAADYVLIPCQTQALAYRGMELLLETVAKIQSRANRQLRVLGILPTMYDQRRTHDREILESLRSVYKELVLPIVIPYRVAIADAFNSAKSVLETAPESDAAQAYRDLAEVIDNA